jgi:hypothetical protein
MGAYRLEGNIVFGAFWLNTTPDVQTYHTLIIHFFIQSFLIIRFSNYNDAYHSQPSRWSAAESIYVEIPLLFSVASITL